MISYRLPDSAERLIEYLDAHRALPFVWGQTDCAALAIGALSAAFPGLAAELPAVTWGTEAAARVVAGHLEVPACLVPIALSDAVSGDVLRGWWRDGGLPSWWVVAGSQCVSSWPDAGVRAISRGILFGAAGELELAAYRVP